VTFDDVSVMQNDVLELLRSLGISDHARNYSCHRVVQDEILPEIRRMRARLANHEQDRVGKSLGSAGATPQAPARPAPPAVSLADAPFVAEARVAAAKAEVKLWTEEYARVARERDDAVKLAERGKLAVLLLEMMCECHTDSGDLVVRALAPNDGRMMLKWTAALVEARRLVAAQQAAWKPVVGRFP
jgi:hypothetical protein